MDDDGPEIIDAEVVYAPPGPSTPSFGIDRRLSVLEAEVGRLKRWAIVVAVVLGALSLTSLLVQLFHGPAGTATVGTARITTTSLPSGSLGVAYLASLSATGGTPPYFWSLSSGSLPSGVSLTPSGSLDGTPRASGTSTFTVAVEDSQRHTTATQDLSLTVVAPPPSITRVQPASGPGAGGTQVIVFGSSFGQATSVIFGGLPATSFTVTPGGNSIVARAPAGAAGVIDITVTAPGGTSDVSASDQYTYLGPSISRVFPKSGAGGTAVVISGSYLQGASAVMFGATPTTSFTVGSGGSTITAVAPSGNPGTVDITVTTPGGTSQTSPADLFTYP